MRRFQPQYCNLSEPVHTSHASIHTNVNLIETLSIKHLMRVLRVVAGNLLRVNAERLAEDLVSNTTNIRGEV